VTDSELRDKMASDYVKHCQDNQHSVYGIAAAYCKADFKAGWDAARANAGQVVDEKLWQEQEKVKQLYIAVAKADEIIKERDNFKQVAITYSIERDEARAAAERLALALEHCAEECTTPYCECDKCSRYDSTAKDALASYRKAHPKADAPPKFGPDIGQDGEIWDDLRGEKK
jgi:hypothetical protein